jgi:hypothetical protein
MTSTGRESPLSELIRWVSLPFLLIALLAAGKLTVQAVLNPASTGTQYLGAAVVTVIVYWLGPLLFAWPWIRWFRRTDKRTDTP